jgi:predicted transcriptional regulator
VISIRISDEEKALLDEISRHDRINISSLMREAFLDYMPRQTEVQKSR